MKKRQKDGYYYKLQQVGKYLETNYFISDEEELLDEIYHHPIYFNHFKKVGMDEKESKKWILLQASTGWNGHYKFKI